MSDVENNTPIINDMYLYILVRTDMDSMGRGKGTAQACHAANQFTDEHLIQPLLNGTKPDIQVLWWRSQAKGFGTTISLAVKDLSEMQKYVELAVLMGAKADITVDPEYPLVDGDAFHIIPNVPTTAYIFGDKNILKPVLENLTLLPNDKLLKVPTYRG